MALSVLVALMMLAVPLASSSNLFVDGGQTNSNGDAPLSAPSEGYTITFQLNSDGKSLDAVDIGALSTASGISWYQNENGDLCALVTDSTITVQNLINQLYATSSGASLITKGKYTESAPDKYAYSLIAWKDASGIMYQHKDITSSDNSPTINKDMTFSAQWLLDEKNCVEVPVKVTFDGETKEYVKAYPYSASSEKTEIEIVPTFFSDPKTEKIMGVTTTGQSVNGSYGVETVYTFKITDSNDTEIDSTSKSAVTIKASNNTIILDYSLKSTYSKVIVVSTMFDEDVVMYTKNNTPYTYNDVYSALKNVTDADGNKIFVPSVKGISDVDGSVLVNDGSYKATSWNDGVPIDSTANATSPLTLNATLNSYKVVFMVNGEYEIVTVNYGELTADKCPFDVTGLTGWVMPKYNSTDNANDYSAFNDFYFTEANISELETKITSANGTYVPVFIAVFTAEPKYAVFDAGVGNFGDKAVTKIVIPVKADSTIPLPVASPVYKEKTLFLGWNGYDAATKAEGYNDVSGSVSVSSDGKVITFPATTATYKYTITFYDGSNVIGIFYLKTDVTSISTVDTLKSSIVAIQYDGKIYGKVEATASEDDFDALDAYNAIIIPDKNGHGIKQWNDVDGNAQITFNDDISAIKDVNLKSIKSDISLYGQFEAKDYVISYNGNTATMTSTMTQIGTVDVALNLFGESTFSNDGFKLKEWNTRPDGNGTSYALNSSFTLTGEQFKELKENSDGEKVFTLYAIWEKIDGSDVPGGNTGGDSNDNTALYLIAGMLAVIAILAIVGIVLMRKK